MTASAEPPLRTPTAPMRRQPRVQLLGEVLVLQRVTLAHLLLQSLRRNVFELVRGPQRAPQRRAVGIVIGNVGRRGDAGLGE